MSLGTSLIILRVTLRKEFINEKKLESHQPFLTTLMIDRPHSESQRTTPELSFRIQLSKDFTNEIQIMNQVLINSFLEKRK